MARLGRAPEPRLWLFERWLSATFVVAWLSLGSQVELLAGSRGLVPFGELLKQFQAAGGVDWTDFPSLFLFGVNDSVLRAGCILGALSSALALFGVLPRLLLAMNVVGYLSYTVACSLFLSFQWDNLLLECGFLAVVTALTANGAPRVAHEREQEPWRAAWDIVSGGSWRVFLFRVVLFKLYFESGLAKYQSILGDWLDGSAMTYYYETAPLPTPLAWYAHALPVTWHHLESWATLAFEILGALFVFSPRVTRLALAAVLTAFQVVNIATANYGFFSTLSIGLHVFLLDESDLWRAHAFVLRRVRRVAKGRAALRRLRRVQSASHRFVDGTRFTARAVGRVPVRVRTAVAALVATIYVGVSFASGVRHFVSWDAELPLFTSLGRTLDPFRMINTYHLFAQITRERVEPEFLTFDGHTWTAQPLHYKPGPLDRSPPFVAPHQPRVDFQLWFYGLSYRRGPPLYVVNLLRRMCADPQAVAPLFVGVLPQAPEAVRVAFDQYHFTTPEERQRTGNVWKREPVGNPRTLQCRRVQRLSK